MLLQQPPHPPTPSPHPPACLGFGSSATTHCLPAPGSHARASATLSHGPELPRAIEMSHLLVSLTSLPILFIPMGLFAFAFFQRRFNGVSGEIGG